MTLSAILEQYTARVLDRDYVRPRTRAGYLSNIAKLRAGLGALEMDAIRRRHVQEWIDAMPGSASVLEHALAMLGIVWQWAAAEEYTALPSPTKGVRIPRSAARAVYGKELPQPRQFVAILKALPETDAQIIETAAFTGMRISELLGLPVASCDFAAGLIHVTQRRDRYGLDAPKSARSQRPLPMGHLLPMLQRRCEGRAMDALVFADAPSYEALLRRLKAAARDVGLAYKGFGPHRLRALCASLMSAAGAGNADLMDQLGHTSLAVTSRYTAGSLPQRAAVLDRVHEMVYGTTKPY